MKYAIKLGKLIRGQKGQATISAAMILLLIGGILIPPCLGFAVVSLKASQSGEQTLMGRYAADSGVEDAICKIKDGNLSVPAYYSLGEKVNDRDVNVTIRKIVEGVYKIISNATSDSGGNATVECYVLNIPSFLNLFDNAITSNGTVCVKGDVNGSVVAEDCTNYTGCNNTNCTELGDLEEPIIWPSAVQLSTYYWKQVKDLTLYEGDIDIDIDTDPIIEPLYVNGMLDIYNSGSAGKNATLNGTVYVTDDLTIGTTQHNFTLNLNNQTIYCEGNIEVGGKCTIAGSGCIIAVGDIDFHPNIAAGSENNFVFIMSVEGGILLHPGGDFYGAIAGDADVTLQPGNVLEWRDPEESEGTINFPTESVGDLMVLSYTIK